jgi:hypothetical protein
MAITLKGMRLDGLAVLGLMLGIHVWKHESGQTWIAGISERNSAIFAWIYRL